MTSGTGADSFTAPALADYALVTYDDGALDIKLRNTAAADEMTLATNGSDPASLDNGLQLELTLALDGSPFVQSFGTPGAGVKTIKIDGRGGDDTIRINQVLAAPDTANPASCGLVCATGNYQEAKSGRLYPRSRQGPHRWILWC